MVVYVECSNREAGRLWEFIRNRLVIALEPRHILYSIDDLTVFRKPLSNNFNGLTIQNVIIITNYFY